MKVRIDAGGREVEIETSDHNLSPKDLADKALEVWQATEGAKTSEGPAYGFTPQTVSPPRGYADFDARPLHVTSGSSDRPVVE